MPFWDKKNTGEKQTFSSLIRGLQHAVSAAMEMAEARNIELLSRYFTEDGDPHIRRLNIDENTCMDIPIISVANPSVMNLKEVEMEFGVLINNVELSEKLPQHGFLVADNEEDLKIGLDRSDLEISFSNTTDKATTMKVKVKFESAPAPEGMAKVVEEFGKNVVAAERE